MKAFFLFLIFSLCSYSSSWAQNAMIKGVILDEDNNPVPSANIRTDAGSGTQSNENGFYLLELPARKQIQINVSHISFKDVQFKVFLEPGESFEFNPVLKTEVEQISEVVLSSDLRKSALGITFIEPELIRKIPGANAGVENILKTLPGVSSNNELSTQYAVRGGNYDENLVYVNEIEVYRPFLVRSGQQEGLSFINPDLVRSVDFSAGGFEAKYGDKLSSVLDVTYKRPVGFEATADFSLVGASVSVGGASDDQKFTAIGGMRYRDNSLLVDAKETETNFHPTFLDVQTYLTYRLSDKLELEFLGSLSQNKYSIQPLTRQTNFGTIEDPLALLIYYSGQEEDQYLTSFGSLKASYVLNENFTAKLIASAYNTREQEHFDILAQYHLGQANSSIGKNNFGEVEFSEGIGSQLTHARNDLDASIVNLEHRGNYLLENDQIEYGVKYTHEDIRDRMREYEIVDSAGFNLRPPLPDFENNQPYEPYEAPILPFSSIRSRTNTKIDRISGFLQWNKRSYIADHQIWFSLGLRNHNWTVTGESFSSKSHSIFSPRAKVAIKPSWEKDMLFRLSTGLYYQPPFYKELRDFAGEVHPEVEAQQALHLVMGNEYSFELGNRPFKLISEIYYKDLEQVNTYTVENVRIRYSANNNAKAYAYGLDFRMNGEFVPGTESWLSFSYLKTEENSDDRGYMARPTDQRLKFGLLFQDYVPEIPSLKMYLNMIYNTGLPGGSPNYADPYLYQSRLPDYKRADLGLSYVFKDESQRSPDSEWLRNFEGLEVGLEIFNLFDAQNSITNTFVRDVVSKTHYAVPNYLSPRVYNVKIRMRF